MLTLKRKTAELISAVVADKFSAANLDANEIYGMLEYPPDKTMGDLALPCFKLSKPLRRSPMEIAKVLSESIACDEFSEINAMGGYLNFKINVSAFAGRVIADVDAKGDKYGASDVGVGKTVVLDYSSPNVAKPFHIGQDRKSVV